EYYGYVVYALSLLSWVAYMVWALAPGLFESVGITYLPDRYWALALPSWGIITACFVWLFLQLHILYHTPDRHSSATLT
ncbi:PIG-P, partial [Blastocladiella britannica]